MAHPHPGNAHFAPRPPPGYGLPPSYHAPPPPTFHPAGSDFLPPLSPQFNSPGVPPPQPFSQRYRPTAGPSTSSPASPFRRSASPGVKHAATKAAKDRSSTYKAVVPKSAPKAAPVSQDSPDSDGATPGTPDSSGEAGDQKLSARRQKIALVCDTCRTRKVKCDNLTSHDGYPCGRCIKDKKICVFKAPPTRSSLTRARMTLLERKTAMYTQIWDSIFPTYPLTQLESEFDLPDAKEGAPSKEEEKANLAHAEAIAKQVESMERARARARSAFWEEWGGDSAPREGKGAVMTVTDAGMGGMNDVMEGKRHDPIPHSSMSSRRPSFSSVYGNDRGHGSHSNGSATNGRNSAEVGILPTPARQFLDDIGRDGAPNRGEDYEWNERRRNDAVDALAVLSSGGGDQSQQLSAGYRDFMSELNSGGVFNARDEFDPDGHSTKLDGMASLAKPKQGVSYLGLSSGAIFLSAIRRLCSDADIPFDALQSQSLQTQLHHPPPGMSRENRTPSLARSSSQKAVDASLMHLGATPLSATMSTAGSADLDAGETFRLPPQSEIWPLVDSYFKYFHTLTPLVHEPTIRAQVLGALPIPNRAGSAVLFNMIFAMGAFDGGLYGDADDGQRYYEKARLALTQDLLEEGTLQLVQGTAIMANYLQRNSRPNAGYLCLGIAARMATALGLHSTPGKTSPGYSPLDVETRKRVWWCIATLEAGCSVTFGRPYGLSRAALTSMPFPVNCNDEHLNVSTTVMPTDAQVPTLYTALIVQAKLARLTAGIHDAILQTHPSLSQLKKYDKMLNQLQSELPPFVQATVCDGPYHLARSVQVWRIRDFRAILYRPVLLAAAWDARQQKNLSPAIQEAISICRTMACLNLSDIELYMRGQSESGIPVSRGTEWYTLFFAFQSCLTLLLSAVWEPGHAAAGSWREMILSTGAWFRNLKTLNKLGVASAQVLESVIATAAKTPSAFTQPTPPEDPSLSMFIGDIPNEQSAAALDVWRYWLEIAGQNSTNFENNMMWDPTMPNVFPMQ